MTNPADPLYHHQIRRDSQKIVSLLEEEGVDLATLLRESSEKLEPIPPEMKGQLEEMRKEIGDELFDKIAAGDSLMQSLDRWMQERFNLNRRILMAFVREKLGTRASQVVDREIVNFLHLVMVAASEPDEGETSGT